MQDTLLLYNPKECREGKKGLSFLPPWEFQTLLSLGTPRLLINLPRNWLSHSCPQSLPASESFPMSQLFTWDGQSTGVSALASFLPKKSPGLISFRMDWLDVFAVQGTLESLLQHHSSKASIPQCSAFFTGECWIPPKKDTLHPRAKEKPQQECRRGKIMFRIKHYTYSSIFAWRIPWTEKPDRLQSMGLQSQTWLRDFIFFSLSITTRDAWRA